MNILMFKIHWVELKKHHFIVIGFLVINFLLLTLLMIPGWMIASKIGHSQKFHLLEQPSNSIENLEAAFIYPSTQESKVHKNPLKISLSNNFCKMEIFISTALDFNNHLGHLENLKEILNNILPKPLLMFYDFKLEKISNPVLRVIPSLTLLTLSCLLSALLLGLWVGIHQFLLNKKNLLKKEQKFEQSDKSKTAHLDFLKTYLEQLYEDLNTTFHSISSKNHPGKSSYEKKIADISQALGRMITFGTLKRNYVNINLIQDIHLALDCFLEEILDKNLKIIKHNLDTTVHVRQTPFKHQLILCSILNIFLNNVPPKSQLSINIEHLSRARLRLMFYDNMPLPWKGYSKKTSLTTKIQGFLFPFNTLIYACADEEIKVEHGNAVFGNYFTLEYQLNRGKNGSNVIKGNFR